MHARLPMRSIHSRITQSCLIQTSCIFMFPYPFTLMHTIRALAELTKKKKPTKVHFQEWKVDGVCKTEIKRLDHDFHILIHLSKIKLSNGAHQMPFTWRTFTITMVRRASSESICENICNCCHETQPNWLWALNAVVHCFSQTKSLKYYQNWNSTAAIIDIQITRIKDKFCKEKER